MRIFLSAWLGAYIVAIGFQTLFVFPLVQRKFQLSEMVFLAGLCLVAWKIPARLKRRKLTFRPTSLDKAIAAYAAAVAVSCLFVQKTGSFLELAGLAYLVVVYLVFSVFLSSGLVEPGSFMPKSFVFCGVAAALLGTAGWVLAMFGTDTSLAWSAGTYYPYFGKIARAQAFTTNPNMLVSILVATIILWFSNCQSSHFCHKIILIPGIVVTGISLTLSKMMVVLPVAGLLVWFLHKDSLRSGKKWLVAGISIFLFLFWALGTHVLVAKKESVNWEALKAQAYAEDHPFAEMGDFYLIKTNYWINKKSATLAGIRHFPWGVGAGGHNEFVAGLKVEGLYPSYFSNYDPHCTYLGAFGEVGFPAFICLLILFFVIGKSLYSLLARREHLLRPLAAGLAGCFLFALIEAVSTDIMNFRHYWVLLGTLGAILRIEQKWSEMKVPNNSL